jgi:hypothetical protein
VARDYGNVRLLGRASGSGFFMRDVLRQAWRPIELPTTVSAKAA